MGEHALPLTVFVCESTRVTLVKCIQKIFSGCPTSHQGGSSFRTGWVRQSLIDPVVINDHKILKISLLLKYFFMLISAEHGICLAY